MVEEVNKKDYVFFWKPLGKKGCLSQWKYCLLETKKHSFKTAEHYMMYKKAMTFDDPEKAQQILSVRNPEGARLLGRQVHNFCPKEWNRHKYNVVYNGNLRKFEQNDDMRKYLLSTADKILIEASPYDCIWGVGLSEKHCLNTPPSQWPGQNLLGKILMEVRQELS